MIKQRIALVLGAGASAPFGFPSGRKLRDDIIRDLGTGSTDLYKVLSTSGSDARQIINFRDALQQSGKRSVDALLERRAEFVSMGKIAIAAALIPYEKPQTLWGGDDNWYEFLWERLGPTLDDVKESQLVVITFNYDRSFEQYFFSALRSTFNIGTDEAAAILRDVLRVIHVHGKLGEMPYDERGQGNSRAYQPVDISNLRDAAVGVAPSIKIVHQGSMGDAEFIQARELLARSELVIFLGFGYLPANVERLGIKDLPAKIGLTGTAFELYEGERDDAIKAVSERMSLGHPTHGVLRFLRTHPLLR